jgi:hypothetical protein
MIIIRHFVQPTWWGNGKLVTDSNRFQKPEYKLVKDSNRFQKPEYQCDAKQETTQNASIVCT